MFQNKPKNTKKRRVELVFDESQRREYLTGFRKRKLERQKVAKEQLEVQLKAEKKRLKSEVKESLSQLYKLSGRPIPELEEILKDEEYDTENVVVKITELSTSVLAKENNWIGGNEAYANQGQEVEEEIESESEEDPDEDAVPGMSIASTETKKSSTKKTADGEDKPSKEKATSTNIKKEMKQKTAQAMKGSKLMKLRDKLERAKNVKQAKKNRHAKARQYRDQQKNQGESRKPSSGSAAPRSGGRGGGKKRSKPASGGAGKVKPNRKK